MMVTAQGLRNPSALRRAVRAIDQGKCKYLIAQRFGVTHKTLMRAYWLYKKYGDEAVMPRKMPQRGRRYATN